MQPFVGITAPEQVRADEVFSGAITMCLLIWGEAHTGGLVFEVPGEIIEPDAAIMNFVCRIASRMLSNSFSLGGTDEVEPNGHVGPAIA
jgi:hypothetical protein